MDGAGGLLRRYVYGIGRVSMATPGTTGFYSTDSLGSVTEISDTGGASLGQFDADPFGDGETATGLDPSVAGNPFGFAGEYRDPVTGLYDLHARQYDPATGRFLAPDPLGAEGASSSYVYVGDNPLRFADPTGMRRQPADPCTAACSSVLKGSLRRIAPRNFGQREAAPPSKGTCLFAACRLASSGWEKCKVLIAAGLACLPIGIGGLTGEEGPPHEPPPVASPGPTKDGAVAGAGSGPGGGSPGAGSSGGRGGHPPGGPDPDNI
jgi:RHS repeat-associated protein